MATAEALLAQPVTRPDAAAHKPAHESAATDGGQSFAEILDAEVEIDGAAGATAAVAAPAAQPAPAMNVATQLAFMAGLESAAPATVTPANPPVDAAPIDAAVAPAFAATPAIAPVVPPPPGAIIQPADPVVNAEPVVASAPTAPATPVATPPPVAPAMATPTPVAKAQPVKPGAPSLQAAVEVHDVVAAPVADAKPAVSTVAAQAVVPVAGSFVAAEAAAIVTPEASKLAPTPTAKPVSTKPAVTTAFADVVPTAPVMAAQPETADPVEAVSTIPANPGTRSSMADAADPEPATLAANQPAAQGAAKQGPAVAAINAASDIKVETPAASSASSTSAADTLAAARAAIVAPAPSAPAQTPAPHPALQAAPAVAVQVYTRFIERFDGRAQRFEVSLQPAELGRVDVRIEVGADRKVHAVLAAHDGAALSDLMRGQRALERALNDAGVDLAKDGLKFELSQDAGRGASGWRQGDGAADRDLAHAWRAFTPIDVPVEANMADVTAALRPFARTSRLDLVA